VEDRLTPGLYLETTDTPASDYAATRVPEVVARTGVERATWWENVCPDRRDLPRVLDDFGLLGVYEVGDDFVPPPPDPGCTGYHFRRTPRPGQGRLTGRPTLGLSLVLISPRAPEQAQALRDWADFVHIRHIAEAGVPGFTMITPYELATGGDPRFLHFYELDTADPEPAFKAMTPTVSARIGAPGTDAWNAWAMTPELEIWYVNSFRLLGEENGRPSEQRA
jgi:hypothetical protein